MPFKNSPIWTHWNAALCYLAIGSMYQIQTNVLAFFVNKLQLRVLDLQPGPLQLRSVRQGRDPLLRVALQGEVLVKVSSVPRIHYRGDAKLYNQIMEVFNMTYLGTNQYIFRSPFEAYIEAFYPKVSTSYSIMCILF